MWDRRMTTANELRRVLPPRHCELCNRPRMEASRRCRWTYFHCSIIQIQICVRWSVPMDDSLDDFSEAVGEAISKISEAEGRPFREVLNHLLLPATDVLRFRESSPDSESGSLNLNQGISILQGAKGMLLSQAHSELSPKPVSSATQQR